MPTTNAIFYHAGCPVCIQAERSIVAALDQARFRTEIVHLGQAKERIAEARRSGVISVPAIVLDGIPLHINFGAKLDALA